MRGSPSSGLYLVRIVKGNDAQGPEAAEHGEDGQAQVVPRRQHDEVVLALAVAGAVALEDNRSVQDNETAEKKEMVTAYLLHSKLR